MTFIQMFWWMLVGHAVADYWAQSDALAKMKNRNRDSSQFCPPGQKPQSVWFYALTAHAIMHGAPIAFLTNSIALGLAETVAHWLIDFGKCDNYYGIHLDQFLHIACKFVWVAIWWNLQ